MQTAWLWFVKINKNDLPYCRHPFRLGSFDSVVVRRSFCAYCCFHHHHLRQYYYRYCCQYFRYYRSLVDFPGRLIRNLTVEPVIKNWLNIETKHWCVMVKCAFAGFFFQLWLSVIIKGYHKHGPKFFIIKSLNQNEN